MTGAPSRDQAEVGVSATSVPNADSADSERMERRRADRRQAGGRSGGRRANDGPTLPPSNFTDGDSVAEPVPQFSDTLAAAQGGFESESPGLTRPRLLRTYAGARAVLGVALLLSQGLALLLGTRSAIPVVLVCLAYAVQAMLLWLLPRFEALLDVEPQTGLRRRQWLATIGVDAVAFGVLHSLEAGATFAFAALLVLPVLMAGVLMPRLAALATAAGVALGLLLVAAWVAWQAADFATPLVQAGLAGIGLFLIVLLASELAGRLAREEASARGSLALARQQAQLNRLVIDELADGLLVVDAQGGVRAANPAARALLAAQGLGPAAPFSLRAKAAWAPLAQAVTAAFAAGRWPEEGSDVILQLSPAHRRSLRVRARFTRPGSAKGDEATGLASSLCVVLLEDVRSAMARVRQEKLAAMGRVSAGIAHEIRNPLAAIAQANALLQEEPSGPLAPAQMRLTQIVHSNVQRLRRIVDDVLEATPREPQSGDLLRCDARQTVAQVLAEFAAEAGPGRLREDLAPRPLWVHFDAEHLRRVVVNLLDNALRHASIEPQAVSVRLAVRDDGSVVLSVASDGEPIAPEVERFLFEPFFSTRSRGSGLGLYICRELCERYGASIEFRMREAPDRYRNSFVVGMRRAEEAVPSAAA